MDKICAMLLLAIAIKRKRRKRKNRKVWCKKRYLNREKFWNKLQLSSESDYKNYVRMSKDSFEELLTKVEPLIKKQDTLLRKAIPAHHRLALTLRYLTSGKSFEALKFLTAVAPQTIGKIVIETCVAIIEVLKDYIMMPASEEDWKKQSDLFYQRWNFSNCIGAIDGKHIAIVKPPGSGSLYFNYKKFFSIIFMAVVNANYEFLIIDIGTNGGATDTEVFNDSQLFSKLRNNQFKIPTQNSPSRSDTVLPYVFVADDTLPLMENIMKPISHKSLTNDEIIFNYRLSRARGVTENAFGILTSRFKILLKTINLSPEKVTIIALACCYLHNFLRKKCDQTNSSCSDFELNTDGETTNEVVSLTPLNPAVIRNTSDNAINIRNQFCAYFNSEGSEPWQTHILEKKY